MAVVMCEWLMGARFLLRDGCATRCRAPLASFCGVPDALAAATVIELWPTGTSWPAASRGCVVRGGITGRNGYWTPREGAPKYRLQCDLPIIREWIADEAPSGGRRMRQPRFATRTRCATML